MSESISSLPLHPVTMGMEISFQSRDCTFYRLSSYSVNIPGMVELYRHITNCMDIRYGSTLPDFQYKDLPVLALIARQHNIIVGIMEDDGFMPIKLS
jgi:hypothetical protein